MSVLLRVTWEDFKKEYINADMYLFLSYTEGMPTVVLEAMIFGLLFLPEKWVA